MNNFSLLAANRLTHLKVVAVALVFATLVVGIGFAALVTAGSGTANATVVKPGKPVTATARGAPPPSLPRFQAGLFLVLASRRTIRTGNPTWHDRQELPPRISTVRHKLSAPRRQRHRVQQHPAGDHE